MPNPRGINQYTKGGGKGKRPPKASAAMHANALAHNKANSKLFKKPSAGGASKIRPARGLKPIKRR